MTIRPVTFPLSLFARQKFDFHAPSFVDATLARELAARLNSTRDLKSQPERVVHAGRLAAAALLDEIFARVIALYCEQIEPDALERAPAFVDESVGEQRFSALLQSLVAKFGAPESRPDAVEFALRLKLANLNPALDNFVELFDDSVLPSSEYEATITALEAYFETLPPFPNRDKSLWAFLLEPIRAFPESVEDQLRFILNEWPDLASEYANRLLLHLDIIREAEKPTFFGPGPAQILDFKTAKTNSKLEIEAFSADREWMPRVVLIAKQTYVWLDQLSKKYGCEVRRLDQIPDAELDELAHRGFTGLWLIGVCQRSRASQTIKRITGNPDAIASAYSLESYEIARELGGESALENLKSRAASRGIRLASDMVPNHMAIDSKWVIEHPDWFLSLPHPPFPQATFNGPDLCEDARIEVRLEDGYFDQSDASVVFQRIDSYSGETRYVYHGNDGTNMPWNDTAQLDYLKPEVRAAVMQTILAVAHQFPIIRFDAAMTLAKRHIHRLWFPAPGSGGDIPSRAGRGISEEEFDELMPQEFWREVVDTLAVQAPDTLLLAEAFWMMEGYFVRTLGMHRVYNSAFMNMLRDEKNAEYRQTLKNTLEFDPEILNRFVNFMNNPDEKTAVEQFGKSDKYFGVATLLATLPGLPMWGHGQIEGYAEKYGMEYPRAYWDEKPDSGFIAHHERVIFPLLHKRELFAGSENFTLYDFWSGDGAVDENVFAYSNRLNDERALVIYNNSQSPTGGWIQTSVGFAQKGEGGAKTQIQRELSPSLGLDGGNNWVIFRDATRDEEFLRSSAELAEKGLFVQLKPYGAHVFLNWREVADESGVYARLAQKLDGAGVSSIEHALRELLLEPILTPFRAVCDGELWSELLEETSREDAEIELETRVELWLKAAKSFAKSEVEIAPIVSATMKRVRRALDLEVDEAVAPSSVETSIAPRAVVDEAVSVDSAFVDEAPAEDSAFVDETDAPADARATRAWALAYALVAEIGALNGDVNPRQRAQVWLREWMLDEPLEAVLERFDAREGAISRLNIWLSLPKRAGSFVDEAPETPFAFLTRLLENDHARELLGINTHQGVIWFRGEGWEALRAALELGARLETVEIPLEALGQAAAQSEFRVVKWMETSRRAAGTLANGKSANGTVAGAVSEVVAVS